MKVSKEKIYEWLEEVKDPEIPVLSLVDLGVIADVIIEDGVKIILTPTFVGCPALDLMKDEIVQVLKKNGIEKIEVEVSYHKPWSSDLISERGRNALRQFGIAPPTGEVITDLELLEQVACPRCNGTNTTLKTPFGSTLCRAIHYCNTCKEAFEQFKPL
jgi:ring-1,2-phenylacetyl-CoA epoxidase subunit PaaD